MISKEKILQRINNIQEEIESLKAEVRKSFSDADGGSLMGKYSYLPEIDEEDFLEIKKILRPSDTEIV